MRLIRSTALAGIALAAVLVATSTEHAHAQEPGRAPVVETFRGSPNAQGNALLGPVRLHAGLVIVRARHNGTGFFALELEAAEPGTDPRRDYTAAYLMINSGGRFDGASAEILRHDAEYYLDINASGPFEFIIEQPDAGTVVPVEQTTFSGERQQVTPIFALPAGTHTITVTSQATNRLFAWLYLVDDLGGGPVFDSSDGRFLQETNGPFETSVTFTTRRPGLYVFHIDARSYDPIAEPPTWTVSVD